MALCERTFTDRPSRPPGVGQSYRIVSYNVLAQELCKEGYEYCPAEALRTTYRRNLILRELSTSRADVLCLQEVECDSSHAFEEHLSGLGYEASAYCRNRGPDEILGLRTFWRADAFEFVHEFQLPIRTLARNSGRRSRAPQRSSPASPTGSMGSRSVCSAASAASGGESPGPKSPRAMLRPSEHDAWTREEVTRHYELWDWLQSIHHVGQAVVLRPKSLGGAADLVIVANAHLYWNPRYPEIKALQAALLVDALAELRGGICALGGGRVPATLAALATSASHGTPLRGRGRGGAGRSGPRSAALAAAKAVVVPGAATGGPSSLMSSDAAPPGAYIPGTPGPALILCGDFNSLPIIRERTEYDSVVPPEGLVSGVYGLLSTGSLPLVHPHHPASRRNLHPASVGPLDLPLRFHSAYAAVLGQEPPWTNWHRHEFKETLDYIWVADAERGPGLPVGPVSSGVPGDSPPGPVDETSASGDGSGEVSGDEVEPLQRPTWMPLSGLRVHVDAVLDVPSDAAVHAYDGGAAGGCPNAGMPSDHIPIAARVMLWHASTGTLAS